MIDYHYQRKLGVIFLLGLGIFYLYYQMFNYFPWNHQSQNNLEHGLQSCTLGVESAPLKGDKLRNLFLLFALLFSVQSFAVELNLSGGESVIIKANTETKVTCGGGSGSGLDCDSAAAAFRNTLSYCNKSYNGGYCAETYWPKYKANNPNCVHTGVYYCLEYCSKSYNGGYCAEKCQ